MSHDSDTEQKILRCIDEGLETLGKSGKRALIQYLERNIGLKKKEIPKNPELFCKGLDSVFGEQGSKAIRKWLVQELLRNFRLEKKANLTFAKAIEMIRAAQEKSH